jgi:hypothetical protein
MSFDVRAPMSQLLSDSAPMSPRAALFGLLLVFVAGLVPFAGTFFEHYPDERNYTNAAITMINTGEYVATLARRPPQRAQADRHVLGRRGELRAVRHRPGGHAPALHGGRRLVVALTYATAVRLTGNRETAMLASRDRVFPAQLVLASMRAIPDVLLCLFMLVSGYGFLNLLVLDRRTPASYWAAYLGAGLAVQTKGLLALVFIAFVWLFAWLDRRGGAPPSGSGR